MRYMLDTDTCIYVIKQHPPEVIQALQNERINNVCISAITLAELEYGVAKSQYTVQNRLALLKFLAPIAVVPFSDSAAEKYGQIRTYLEKIGTIIGPYDMLIAAQALSEGLTLVTNNTREYDRIPGLSIENWVRRT